jgi:hypothetical protein
LSFDEPPWDDERDVESNDDEHDEAWERIQALSAEGARLEKNLAAAYVERDVAVELVRRAEGLIGVVPNAAANAKWECDARALLDPIDGKSPF